MPPEQLDLATPFIAPGERPVVLVVDDDVRSGVALARLLRLDGYDAEVVIDGAAALARLTRSPVPDALVTELHLPHADGLALARYARSRRLTMPVFFVTDRPHAVDAAVRRGRLEEPVAQLTKPLDYPALLRGLDRALGVVHPGADSAP